MSESRSDAVRAQQAGPPLTAEQISEAFEQQLAAHNEHPWHQVGRCVYCGPCHTRLYQGTLPEGHPVYKPPRKPTAADKMRRAWGMD